MKNKTKKQQEKCSMDEEMLMWTSYRYCIGRKTYVSSLASYIAKKYYPILSEQRMLFTAQDIRNEIEDHFNWNSINFYYISIIAIFKFSNYCFLAWNWWNFCSSTGLERYFFN